MPFARQLHPTRLALALLFVLLLVLSGHGKASADTDLQAWMQDDPPVLQDPVATLQQMRQLGVDRVRLSVRWQAIAPRAGSRVAPPGFEARADNPAAYADASWAQFDRVVQDAQQIGIGLSFDLVGGAPLWATGPGAPTGKTPSKTFPDWEPNAKDFAAFVQAIGTRYSGNYDPVTHRLAPGNPDDLPRVDYWSVWNEPDYGPSLSPQGLPGDLTVPHSPEMYRGLVDAAWSGLQQSGHGGDTILIGELAPRGYPVKSRPGASFGTFSGMTPILFVQNMYCVDSHYRPLRGKTASLRGCPSTAAASRRFRAQNPGLFQASGFSDHPYMRWYAPNDEQQPDPNYASLAEIDNLPKALDRIMHTYGSTKRYPIWNTEFGYITSPPKKVPDYSSNPTAYWVSPTKAALYLNWAEYISYRNPRIKSFMQYLLQDPLPATKADGYGGFASGLETFHGAPKATYAAWRMPIFMPQTKGQQGGSLEVWGDVRPAHYALLDDPLEDENVEIQFAPTGTTDFSTVATVPITDPNGYFDTDISFPASGNVRLAWTYPQDDSLLDPGQQIFSRIVAITLH